jgi:hypothetical protein
MAILVNKSIVDTLFLGKPKARGNHIKIPIY